MRKLDAVIFAFLFTLVYGFGAISYQTSREVTTWSPEFTELYLYVVHTGTVIPEVYGEDDLPDLSGEIRKVTIRKCVIPITSSEFDYLCKIVWCEAGLEPFDGQVATASSVVNRVLSPLFPNTVTDVLWAPGQYSTVLTKKFQTCKPTAENIRAVKQALSNPTPGVLYFGRSPITHNGVFQIGHHYYSK